MTLGEETGSGLLQDAFQLPTRGIVLVLVATRGSFSIGSALRIGKETASVSSIEERVSTQAGAPKPLGLLVTGITRATARAARGSRVICHKALA